MPYFPQKSVPLVYVDGFVFAYGSLNHKTQDFCSKLFISLYVGKWGTYFADRKIVKVN